MARTLRCLSFLGLSWLPLPASAQAEPQLTLETVLERGAELRPEPARVLWLPDGHDATVVCTDDDGNESLRRVASDGTIAATAVFTAAALHAALDIDRDENADAEAEPRATREPLRLPPLTWLDARTVRIERPDSVLHWSIPQQRATPVLRWPTPDDDASFGEPTHAVAPGDGHVALRMDHQLWLVDRSGTRRRLTDDGSPDIVYGSAAHRAEIGITRGLFWSADGRFLAFYREDLRPIAEYPFQDVAGTPPTRRHGRYPMAGDADSIVTVLVCDTTDYSVTTLEHDPAEDLYWTNVGFAHDDTLTVALVDRGQDDVRLVRFDARSGRRLGTLLKEHDAEWLEPEHPPTFLADGRMLWWSRRTGYRHLFLHGPEGELLRQVTEGEFDVQQLVWLAPDERTLLFAAAGTDPRQLHLFEARLDRTGQRQVTHARGTHTCEPSPDGARFVDVWSNLDEQPITRLVDTATGDAVELPGERGYEQVRLPGQRFFELAAEDGSPLYGHLALPPDFDPTVRHPVLLYVYGGPHAQLVRDTWFGGAPDWLQAFACEGFVVARLDNRGTPNRGIAFEQQTWRRLGTIEVEDQLRAVAWLRRQPWVDGDRIGVHGWSFGGYMTLRLMLLHPDAFACGISGAPVTDWALYETGYTERYMDSPLENPAGYEASSCLPIAGALRRPLLLVHGTDDDTVVPAHTLRFVDRCIAEGVDLDYFPYPQQRHGLRGPARAHFLRKMLRYLREHLTVPADAR